MRIEFKENNQPTREEIIEMAKGQASVTIAGTEALNRADIAEIIQELSNETIWLEATVENVEKMAETLEVLHKAGATGVKFHIDTLNHTNYKKQNGESDSLDELFKGINAVTDQQMTVRIQAKIKKGFNDTELMDFLQLTLQHNYEIIFTAAEGMTFDEIKAKMPALRPVQNQPADVELFAYPMSRGKIGFARAAN